VTDTAEVTRTAERIALGAAMTAPEMADAWHEQTEWENGISYAQGYADGYAAAEQAIAAEITAAIGEAPGPYSVKAVIRWLIRDFDQPQEAAKT
jgi:hypothetical protein